MLLCDLMGVNWGEAHIIYDPLRGHSADDLSLDHPITIRPGEHISCRHGTMEDANCFGIQALVTKLHGNIISTWPVNSIAPMHRSSNSAPKPGTAGIIPRPSISFCDRPLNIKRKCKADMVDSKGGNGEKKHNHPKIVINEYDIIDLCSD